MGLSLPGSLDFEFLPLFIFSLMNSQLDARHGSAWEDCRLFIACLRYKRIDAPTFLKPISSRASCRSYETKQTCFRQMCAYIQFLQRNSLQDEKHQTNFFEN
jgi:hypothetical protein